MRRLVKQQRHGRITIPKEFRDALALGANDRLSVTLEDGKLVLEPVRLTMTMGSPWLKALYDHYAPVRNPLGNCSRGRLARPSMLLSKRSGRGERETDGYSISFGDVLITRILPFSITHWSRYGCRPARDVDPRLDGDDHSVLQLILRHSCQPRRLVDEQADPVSQAVPKFSP